MIVGYPWLRNECDCGVAFIFNMNSNISCHQKVF